MILFFYSHMKKLENFEDVWSVQRMLCWIENDTLPFIEEFE